MATPAPGSAPPTTSSNPSPESASVAPTPTPTTSSVESPLPLSSSTPAPPATTLAMNYAGINAGFLSPGEGRGGGGGLDNAEETVGNGVGTARGKPAGFTVRKLARPNATPTVLQAAATPLPSPTPSAQPPAESPPPPFPALHLTPLNDTFVPKQIALGTVGNRIKIGRQTNAKTIPNATNGYFDSKVLSRMHAEVWSEDGKVFIKDVKSSNGTFINGERLSPEAAESDIFELHTDDVVEFGIDIVSDDNKTIVHHKVATKVYLVMNLDDAAASSREFNTWYRNAGEAPMHRRVKPANAGNGLSFEHILNRLQGEIQKSRDTGTNLGDLTSTLTEVQDTLGGGLPPPLPPSLPRATTSAGAKDATAHSISLLQSQLSETQSSLAGHVGRIQDLESLLSEHKGIKFEVGLLRTRMEDTQREMERLVSRDRDADASGRGGRESPVAALLEAQEDESDEEADDARSVVSVDTVRGNGRPRSSSMRSEDVTATTTTATKELAAAPTPDPSNDKELQRSLLEQNALLAARLESLAAELSIATVLSLSLRAQHASAASTIASLQSSVSTLEHAVQSRLSAIEVRASEESDKWEGWRASCEEGWKKEREGWAVERAKLEAVVREWEERRSGGESASESESAREEEGGKKRKAKGRKKKGKKGVKAGDAGKGEVAMSVNGKVGVEAIAVDDVGGGLTKSRTTSSAVDDSTSLSSSKNQLLPYASAGAIVILSVAAAWALSLKLKE